MKAYTLAGMIAIAGALALGGCKVGPNYKAPPVPAPPSYSDSGHNGDWAAAKPADAVDRGAWWAVYHDPQLEDLEQRCAKANQSIAAALHAYEQAHDLVRENRSNLYPTLAIGASANRDRVSANKPLRAPGQTNDYWDFLLPLSVSWEPDLWGGVRRQIESSAANAQASAADLANTRLSLQGLLSVTYFQLRGLDLQAQLLRTTIDALQPDAATHAGSHARRPLEDGKRCLAGGSTTGSDASTTHRSGRAARAVRTRHRRPGGRTGHRIPHSRAASCRRSTQRSNRCSLRVAGARRPTSAGAGAAAWPQRMR